MVIETTIHNKYYGKIDTYLGFCVLSKVQKDSDESAIDTIKQDISSINKRVDDQGKELNEKLDTLIELMKNSKVVFDDKSSLNGEDSDKKEWVSRLKMNLFK